MDVRLPDGTVIQNVPDGTTKADLVAKLQKNGMNVPSEWLAPAQETPASVKLGNDIMGLPRQLGLTGRYLLEGPAQAAQIVTEPIRRLVVNPLLKLAGRPGVVPLGQTASAAANTIGLPAPETANERVVGDASRLVAGVMGLGGAGKLAQSSPGLAGQVGNFFASNLGQQAVSATGAGIAGGSVREAGGGPWAQAGAALLGGIAAPLAANSVSGVANSVGSAIKNKLAPQTVQREVDQQISLTLRQQGIDWSQIPERIKQTMREDVRQALDTGGELNPDALRRLLDFRTVGATPTRGMLTQDPVQITREANLAKTGANSTDLGLQRLPQLQNQNTATLLRLLDEAGAQGAPDALATGERVLGALNQTADRARSNINNLYSAARDTTGRSAQLDGATFTAQANQALDQALLGGALPESVATHLNRIARGEVPFTVDYAEQLKTAIGNLQRSTSDGQQRMALGLVRRALDNTPLRPAPQVNPGNLPAVPGTVPASPALLGEESINAFNQARAANRAFMQRVEQTPALQAALDGAQPDKFVQQFIIGQGRDASVAAVSRLRQEIADSPQAIEAVKQNIVAHLRSAATNGTEDVTKFSPVAYNKALNSIGERKLAQFFDPEEVRRLQAVGRTGTMMTAQPAGTAVNNSNSGALLLGRGIDLLDSVAGKLPLGLDTTIQGVLRGVQQGGALNVPRGLLSTPQSVPLAQRIGLPAVYGGLLAAQPINQP